MAIHEMMTEPTTEPDERAGRVAAADARALLRAQGLARLLDRRPELRGVHPPADLTVEAVRWSA